MRKRYAILLFASLAFLFIIANRGAYKSYFQDDELDNIHNTSRPDCGYFVRELISPRLEPYNFRPVGHSFFAVMARTAKLNFRPYVIAIHSLHLFNVLLFILLARKFRLTGWPAIAGAFFFAFHVAAFDVYWKPMYVFDLLCGTLCLLTLILYAEGRLVLSFLSFWLAYKSKEMAVMLPAVLAAYEFYFGDKRWKRLAPFFLVSASFGVQAVLANASKPLNDYSLRFSPGAVWNTAVFYATNLFTVHSNALAIVIAVLLPVSLVAVFKDRRLNFGLIAFVLMLLPMLFLPGRLFSAYLYVPLIGAALVFGAVAAHRRAVYVGLVLAVWLGINFAELRNKRGSALAIADENRAFVTALAGFAPVLAGKQAVIYDGKPPQMQAWGVVGAVRYLSRNGSMRVEPADSPEAAELLSRPPVALMSWDDFNQKFYHFSRSADTPDAPYISMTRETPIWQLREGWYSREGLFRWIAPRASARLVRPQSAEYFELAVNVGPGQIERNKRARVRVFAENELVGDHEFTKHGFQTVRWNLKSGAPGSVRVRFEVEPPLRPSDRDSRSLGIPIVGFGFK